MAIRDEMLAVTRRATEVLASAKAKDRLADGYSRIDPFAIAALDNVPVLVRPLEHLLGAFLREDQPGIMVNGDRPAGLVHMTCAHELGHYFLGHATTADAQIDYDAKANLIERQADWFAYALLTPRWLIAEIMRRKGWTTLSLRSPAVVYQLSLRMGVSYTGTVWSLQRQKLLSPPEATTLARVSPKDIKRSLSASPIDDARTQDVWLLDQSDQDLILEPRPSDRFTVELPNHLSAGYMWTIDEAVAQGFTLQPVLVEGEDEDDSIDSSDVGHSAPVQYEIERTTDVPSVDVRFDFQESQPWPGGDEGDASFGLRTKFESIQFGLTPESRTHLVRGVAEQ
ncbi:ImmA/IrrE family metallo-endopeptidase [Burkholderia cepacia]|uniref:ImmA/IrrE family metallo-endopeptidase n=1 Tax=Burkholderia cepacia TaxID=292 RepID=UPI000F59FB59|nr:ImmA/IrrE family metallo-endopeptidase [Burkholderia cepacia]RQT56335.1 ImmA/IrrE family metallo-endopeptidase [Burkholderia cepacia]